MAYGSLRFRFGMNTRSWLGEGAIIVNSFLLKEDNGFLLLEDGGKIIL